MSQQYLSLLSQGVTAAGSITVRRFVGYDGNQASTQGQKCFGVSEQSATAAGQTISVTIIGTALIEAGGSLSAGQAVISDNLGRAIANSGALGVAAGSTAVTSTAANGAVLTGSDLPETVLGYVIPGQSASGAGQFVEILLKH